MSSGVPRQRTFHVCNRCAFAWGAPDWVPGCPNCKHGIEWVSSFFYAHTAERYAHRVDPAEVERELAELAARRAAA